VGLWTKFKEAWHREDAASLEAKGLGLEEGETPIDQALSAGMRTPVDIGAADAGSFEREIERLGE